MTDAPSSTDQPGSGAPKRRGRGQRRHTVGKVLLASVVVLGLVTGLSVAYLYRHLNGNLSVLNVSGQLDHRPAKKKFNGPHEPLNILVMGSDSRDCAGCNIDNLTGGGQRSDTTILLHLSADRQHAYGVSIPRDSIVNRPDCKTADGKTIPGAKGAMWNEAFSVGGPACLIQQFEQLSGVRLDHYVVVNFEGFRGMVDAIGGVQVCVPQTIDDRSHGIYIPAGNRKIEGAQALKYVRERHAIGNGSDIGRMKRQQAFIASMAHQVVSAGTLTRADRLIRFLDAATKSLTVDPGLQNIVKLAELGSEFRNIGLDKIQFITIPNTVDPTNPNRLVWAPTARDVWRKLKNDEPLTRRLSQGAISAAKPPGSGAPSGSPSGNPSGGSSSTSSASQQAAAAQAAENGLCA